MGMERSNEGLKIKAFREEAGLTQSELADYIGVAQVTVSAWERGVASPDAFSQRLVDQVLRYPPSEFKKPTEVCHVRLRGKRKVFYEFSCGNWAEAKFLEDVNYCPYCERPTDLKKPTSG
ncbi:helix-turn-helix transcriptional regulator, partial [Escherichia coli]|nr:helix-turn-helix transcriptional regulator [Escherichia coli]